MPIKNFDPYDFSKKEIDGVIVYWKHFPTAPCIHIHLCFNTGSLNDPADTAGLSHFLEHMIFDGSPTLPTKKDIREWSKLHALDSWNAWTWFSNTDYHLQCLPENFEIVLASMKDMIFRPLLKDDDVQHERSVITQEAWNVYKNEKYLAYTRKDLENTYHGTARERISSPLGWPESISKITQNDISKWHKKNYGKGNFFMVIAGNIQESDLNKLENFLQNIPTVEKSKFSFGTLQKPKQLLVTKTGDEIGDPKKQVEISFNRVIDPRIAPNVEIQSMAGALLEDILFERLRTERALCYSVSAGRNSQRDFISLGVAIKAKEKHTDVIITEFWKAITDIVSGAEHKRFDILKRVRIDRLKSIEEITDDIADDTLSDIWRYGKTITKKELLKVREGVSYKDVANCISQAFEKDWTVTEIILPSKSTGLLVNTKETC